MTVLSCSLQFLAFYLLKYGIYCEQSVLLHCVFFNLHMVLPSEQNSRHTRCLCLAIIGRFNCISPRAKFSTVNSKVCLVNLDIKCKTINNQIKLVTLKVSCSVFLTLIRRKVNREISFQESQAKGVVSIKTSEVHYWVPKAFRIVSNS